MVQIAQGLLVAVLLAFGWQESDVRELTAQYPSYVTREPREGYFNYRFVVVGHLLPDEARALAIDHEYIHAAHHSRGLLDPAQIAADFKASDDPDVQWVVQNVPESDAVHWPHFLLSRVRPVTTRIPPDLRAKYFWFLTPIARTYVPLAPRANPY